jgi:hypothetical protein
MARMNDPMLPSSAAAAIAESAVDDAWRLFSDQNWTLLLAEDRAERGDVDRDAPSDLGQFMQKVGRTRYRSPRRATGTDG